MSAKLSSLEESLTVFVIFKFLPLQSPFFLYNTPIHLNVQARIWYYVDKPMKDTKKPINIRISYAAWKRLRMQAAKEGITIKQLIDELSHHKI